MEEIILEKYKSKLISGKEISEFIKFELQQKIKNEKIIKNLAVLLIGDDENSKTYIKLKRKFAEFIGVGFNEYVINEEEIEQDIIDAINFLNADEEIDGIIMQLPIPKKFNQEKILNLISREKDVDGFLDETSFSPVLGKVIKRILIEYDDEFNKWENRNISIVCNSDVFSSKIEKYLNSVLKNIHIDTNIFIKDDMEKIKKSTSNADIIISIVGEKNFIKKDFVKEGAIVIDIGITKDKDGIHGDANIKDIIDKVSYITPPIGGVGPLTVAMLFDNLVNPEK